MNLHERCSLEEYCRLNGRRPNFGAADLMETTPNLAQFSNDRLPEDRT